MKGEESGLDSLDFVKNFINYSNSKCQVYARVGIYMISVKIQEGASKSIYRRTDEILKGAS